MDFQATQVLEDNEGAFSQNFSQSTNEKIQIAILEIAGKKYPIFKGITTIGRRPSSDICIDDPTVSKSHAEIEATTKATFISDLKSSNKTRMNNEILRPERFYEVHDGSILVFGIIKGLFMLARPDDTSILVPETPHPGLKPRKGALSIKKIPYKSKNSSSFNDSDDSEILGTQQYDADVFRRPSVPGPSRTPSTSKEQSIHDLQTQTFNNLDDNDKKIVRSGLFDDSNLSIHDSSSELEKTNIFDVETQKFDKLDAIGGKSNEPDRNSFVGSHRDTSVSIHDCETQRFNQMSIGPKNSSICDAETQKFDNSVNDAKKVNSQARKLENSVNTGEKGTSIHDIETQIVENELLISKKTNIFDVETQILDFPGPKCQNSNIHNLETQIPQNGGEESKILDKDKKLGQTREISKSPSLSESHFDNFFDSFPENIHDVQTQSLQEQNSVQNPDKNAKEEGMNDENITKSSMNDSFKNIIEDSGTDDDDDDDDDGGKNSSKIVINKIESTEGRKKEQEKDSEDDSETDEEGLFAKEAQIITKHINDNLGKLDEEKEGVSENVKMLNRKSNDNVLDDSETDDELPFVGQPSKFFQKYHQNGNDVKNSNIHEKTNEPKNSEDTKKNQSKSVNNFVDDSDCEEEDLFANFLHNNSSKNGETTNERLNSSKNSESKDVTERNPENSPPKSRSSVGYASDLVEERNSSRTETLRRKKETNPKNSLNNSKVFIERRNSEDIVSHSITEVGNGNNSYCHQINKQRFEIDGSDESETDDDRETAGKHESTHKIDKKENNKSKVINSKSSRMRSSVKSTGDENSMNSEILDADSDDPSNALTQIVDQPEVTGKIKKLEPNQISNLLEMSSKSSKSDLEDFADEMAPTQVIEPPKRKSASKTQKNKLKSLKSRVEDHEDNLDPTQIMDFPLRKLPDLPSREVTENLYDHDDTAPTQIIDINQGRFDAPEDAMEVDDQAPTQVIPIRASPSKSRGKKSKSPAKLHTSREYLLDSKVRDGNKDDSTNVPTGINRVTRSKVTQAKESNHKNVRNSRRLRGDVLETHDDPKADENIANNDPSMESQGFDIPSYFENANRLATSTPFQNPTKKKKFNLSLTQKEPTVSKNISDKTEKSSMDSRESQESSDLNDSIAQDLHSMFGNDVIRKNKTNAESKAFSTQELEDILKPSQSSINDFPSKHNDDTVQNDLKDIPKIRKNGKGLQKIGKMSDRKNLTNSMTGENYQESNSGHKDVSSHLDEETETRKKGKTMRKSERNSKKVDDESQDNYFSKLAIKRKKNAILDSQGPDRDDVEIVSLAKDEKKRKNLKSNELGTSEFSNKIVVDSNGSISSLSSPRSKRKRNDDKKAETSELEKSGKRLKTTAEVKKVDKHSENDDNLSAIKKVNRRTARIGNEMNFAPNSSAYSASSEDIPSVVSSVTNRKLLNKSKLFGSPKSKQNNRRPKEPSPPISITPTIDDESDDDAEDTDDYEKLTKMADSFLATSRAQRAKKFNETEASKPIINVEKQEKSVGKVKKAPKRSPKKSTKAEEVLSGDEFKDIEEEKVDQQPSERRGRSKNKVDSSSNLQVKPENKPTNRKKIGIKIRGGSVSVLDSSIESKISQNSSPSLESQEIQEILESPNKSGKSKRKTMRNKKETLKNEEIDEEPPPKMKKIHGDLLGSTRAGKSKSDNQTPTVLFTGLSDSDSFRNSVTKLGGSVTDNPTRATILVTDKVRRTFKFFCAVSRSIPIASISWIQASVKAGYFVDPSIFTLQDPASETKFDFKLTRSLSRAKETKLLDGYTIVITSKINQPSVTEIKSMIQVSGGKTLIRAPRSWLPKTVIVSCEEDVPNVRKMLQKAPINHSIPVVGVEFILSGILKQELEADRYKLRY